VDLGPEVLPAFGGGEHVAAGGNVVADAGQVGAFDFERDAGFPGGGCRAGSECDCLAPVGNGELSRYDSE
jgi:hypothetical protein